MKNIYLITLFVFILVYNSLHAQEIQKISLKRTYSNGPFNGAIYGTKIVDDISTYKIPKKYTNYIIKKAIVLRSADSKYFSLTGKFKERNYLSILVNINKDKSRTVLIDANNDDDFNGEKALIFPELKPIIESIEYISLPILYLASGSIVETYIRPLTYQSYLNYNNPKEKEFYLLIQSFSNLEGKLNVDNVEVPIFVEDSQLSPYASLKNSKIAVKQEGKNFSIYESDQIIKIAETKILIDSISIDGSELFLRVFSNGLSFKEKGFNEGFILSDFSTLNIEGKELFLPFKGGYTLFDFWGTWCGPCKELTPNLVALHEKFKNKVKLVSLAGSSKEEDVKSYILTHRMDWTHIIESKETALLFNYKMFNIKAYPTFLLVDPAGKILIRGTGEMALNRINSYLNKTL